MAIEIAVHESLPYIDPEPTPEALAAARALISAEAATSEPPSDSNTTRPPPPTFSPAITAELTRVSSSTPLAPLDLSRYEAQEPPASGAPREALLATLANAYVSDAYLAARGQNLDLLDRWGKNAWLLSNYGLEADLKALEKDLADTKKHIDIVNHDRKRRQDDVAAEMQALEDSWRRGVGKVLETEIAVEELQAQIREELRKRSAQEDQNQASAS